MIFILYLFFAGAVSYFATIKSYIIAFGILGIASITTLFLCQEHLRMIKGWSVLKLIFWLTIISSFFGPAFFTIPIGSYHLFLFRSFLPFIFFFIILQILINRGKLSLSTKNIKIYLLFLIFWLIYSIISIVWAIDKLAALRQIYFLFEGLFLIFLIILFVKNKKDFKNFFILWIFLLIGLLGIGLWEHLTGNHLALSTFFEEARTRFKFMPTGTFHNPNDFATFLGLSFPFIIVWLHYKKGLKNNFFGIGILLTGLYILVATGSRGNLLALILELFVFFLFLLKLDKKIKTIVITILIISFLFIVFPSPISKIFKETTTQLKNFSSEYQWTKGSIINRLNLAKNALYYLRESYGFGVGARNIEWHINNYSPYWIRPNLLNLHNWWVEILANYGIFIFAGYLLFYFGLIHNLWKIWKQKLETYEKIICETIFLSLIGFFVASISPSSISAFTPQWILFGLSLAFLNYYRIKYKKT